LKGAPLPVNFQPGIDKLHWAGDRLFVARWRCGAAGSHGVGISAHDRDTLVQQAEVTLAQCDDGDDGNVVSMAADERHLYVAMELTGPRPREVRTDLYVLDRTTLAVVDAGSFEEHLGLIGFHDGSLLGCPCWPFGGDTPCRRIETQPLASAPDERHQCVGSADGMVPLIGARRGTGPVSMALGFDGQISHTRSFIASSAHPGGNPSALVLTITPRHGTASDRSIRIERGSLWLGSEDGDRLIVLQMHGQTQRLLAIDARDGRQRTLGAWRYRQGEVPALALDGRHAYVGIGRDLHVIALDSGRLHAVQREFIQKPSTEQATAHGSSIERLLVDRGRLVALTRDGTSSRSLSLKALGGP